LEFQVDLNHRYVDDPEGKKFEIREMDRSKYFVFILTGYRTSMAFDESRLFDEVMISLEFKEDTLDQHSKVGYFSLSLAISVFMVIAFMLILLGLPDVRKALLGTLSGAEMGERKRAHTN